MQSLEMEYEKLLLVKEKLCREIDEIEEKEALASAKAECNSHQKFLLRKMPLEWANTTFNRERSKLLPYISTTFSAFDLQHIIGRISLSGDAYKIHYCAMLCTGVEESSKGVILSLQDPYRQIVTYPLRYIDYEKAKNWISRMLVVKLRITKDAHINNEFFLERVKVLKFTKQGIIERGIEKVSKDNLYTLLETKSNKFQNKIDALSMFEKYFRSNQYCVYRERENILNICSKSYKFTLLVLKNQLYHILDDAEKITDIDISVLTYNEELLIITSDYAELVYNEYI